MKLIKKKIKHMIKSTMNIINNNIKHMVKKYRE